MPPKKAAKKGAAAEKPAATDAADAQQQAFIQQSLQASVATLKDRVRDLEESNQRLRRTRTDMGKETKDFVSYFQGELEQRDAKIDQLRDKLRTSEFEAAKAVRRLQAQLEEQKETFGRSATEKESELRSRILTLQEELDALSHYKMNKLSIDAQVAGLTEALGAEKQGRREEVSEVERRWMMDKKATIDDRKAEYAAMKRRARQEAQGRLGEDVKRIVTESKKATGELRFLREQTRVLRRETAALTEQNKVLAREVEIAADKEREYAISASRREGERREMVARIQALEGSVGAMAREYERKRADDVRAAGAGAEDLAVEAQGLRTLVRMKNQELRTVRRLAQAVLGQRTEVEQLLIDALTEVKEQVRRRRAERRRAKAKAATVGAGGIALPSLAPGGLARGAGGVPASPLRSTRPAGAAGDGGEAPAPSLAQLSPEDRERVLSLLFARINEAEAGAGAANRAGTAATPGGAASPVFRDGRVSKLSVGHGFTGTDGGIGRPFGLAADLPDDLPGGDDTSPYVRGLAGSPGGGGDAKAAEDEPMVEAGPLASQLLREGGAAAAGEGAGLA